MSELSFEVGERPAVTRPGRDSEPNPFEDTVREFAEKGKDEQAVYFTLSGVKPASKGETATGNSKVVLDPAVDKALKQLRKAGAKVDRTVRTAVEYDEKKSTARVAFWLVPKITREAASADA